MEMPMLLKRDCHRLVVAVALVSLDPAGAADSTPGQPVELACPAVAPARCTMRFSGAYTGRLDCEAALLVMGSQSNIAITVARNSNAGIDAGGTFGIEGPIKLDQTYTYANLQLATGNFKFERAEIPVIWWAKSPSDSVPAVGSMALRICSTKQRSEAPMPLYEVHGVARITYDPLLQAGGTASIVSQISF